MANSNLKRVVRVFREAENRILDGGTADPHPGHGAKKNGLNGGSRLPQSVVFENADSASPFPVSAGQKRLPKHFPVDLASAAASVRPGAEPSRLARGPFRCPLRDAPDRQPERRGGR
ncbi:hypothetical protein SKAU_G00009180 [Synaphobranchus kaupii]|uniref:Uncharacterized protein n=1 Tax=Synaphobranchus kaupii TaxID=118154 RepID=A0A9Q1GAQ9_SYNKA|nr:hypothetical protein SKAU_G00009180 [Synaphobranchus kaupii]